MSKFNFCKSDLITAVLKVSRDALTMIVTGSEIQNVFQKMSEKKGEVEGFALSHWRHTEKNSSHLSGVLMYLIFRWI